jgi:hypothetical protein
MPLKIRAGYELSYDCLQPTLMILTLNVHPSRRHDLLTLDKIHLTPAVPITEYHDGFGNTCHVPCGVMRSTSGPASSSRRHTGSAPTARISSISPTLQELADGLFGSGREFNCALWVLRGRGQQHELCVGEFIR